MKNIIVGIGFFLAVFAGNVSVSLAQSVSVNVNIGNQPAWGPAGYDYALYYYFPDIDIYYDINNYLFYYPDRGRWRASRYLPGNYARYDLYGMYKVVINQSTPWLYADRYRRQYALYRGMPPQVVILNSSDRRFYGARYNRIEWVDPRRYGNYPYSGSQRPNGYYRPGSGHVNSGRPNQGNPNRPNSNNRPNHGMHRPDNGRPNNRPGHNGGHIQPRKDVSASRSSSSGRDSQNVSSSSGRRSSNSAENASGQGRSLSTRSGASN